MSLADIRERLQELAAAERSKPGGSEATAVAAAELVGGIDPQEPEVIQSLRRELRLLQPGRCVACGRLMQSAEFAK